MAQTTYLKPNYEIDLLNDSDNPFTRVIGIDEVGRGAWAGPVAIGVYIYDLNSPFVIGINDSKKISLKNRELLHEQMNNHNFEVSYGSVQMIDKYGIGKTIEKLILQAVNKYNDRETFFFIDGTFSQDFGENTKKVIKGDSTYYSIACASIVAKVERDNLMNELDSKYTGYGLGKHKGYGTKQHREALERNGITNVHRLSYKPVEMYNEKKV